MKSERTKIFSNIQEGISIAEQGLSLRGVKRHTTCLLLDTLANLLAQKCRREGGTEVEWNQTVKIHKIAVGSESSLLSRVTYMHNLSAQLTERYEEFHNEKDLIDAINYGLRCLRSTSVSHPLRSTYLTGLASRYDFLYTRTKNLAYLDYAVGLNEAAVQLNPTNEIALNNFATATMNRWFATKNKSDLRLTIDRMEFRYKNPAFSNFGRVRGAIGAGAFAMELRDYPRAIVLLKGAVSLLPEVYGPLDDRRDLQHVLSQLSELPDRIASAILLHDNQSVVDALSSMESARGIIASLVIKTRSSDKVAMQELANTAMCKCLS
jgi:hypothetical protein